MSDRKYVREAAVVVAQGRETVVALDYEAVVPKKNIITPRQCSYLLALLFPGKHVNSVNPGL